MPPAAVCRRSRERRAGGALPRRRAEAATQQRLQRNGINSPIESEVSVRLTPRQARIERVDAEQVLGVEADDRTSRSLRPLRPWA